MARAQTSRMYRVRSSGKGVLGGVRGSGTREWGSGEEVSTGWAGIGAGEAISSGD